MSGALGTTPATQTILYSGDASGATWATYAIVTSNQLFKDAVGVSFVNGASFSLTSGVTYLFAFHIIHGTSSSGDGPRYGLSFSGANYFSALVEMHNGAAAGTGDVQAGVLLASGTSITLSAFNAANTYYYARVTGVINPNANTLFSLLSGVDTAGGTMCVRAGSFGRLETIA